MIEVDPRDVETPARGPLAHERRTALFWTGSALLVLAAIALIFPLAASFATTLVLGGLLAIAGAVKLGQLLEPATAQRRAAQALWALLYIGTGVLVFWRPAVGIVSLTILLAGLFIASGVIRGLIVSLPERPRGWPMLFASAVLSIALGLLVIIALPYSALWFPGVVLAVDFLGTGVALLALWRESRRAAR